MYRVLSGVLAIPDKTRWTWPLSVQGSNIQECELSMGIGTKSGGGRGKEIERRDYISWGMGVRMSGMAAGMSDFQMHY